MQHVTAEALKEWSRYAHIGDEFVYMQSGSFILNNLCPLKKQIAVLEVARELESQGRVFLFQRRAKTKGSFDYLAVRCSEEARAFVKRISGAKK